MAILDPFGYGTHEVLNQAPAMVDYDAYAHDPALGKILSIYNAEWAAPHASAVGKRVGSAPRARVGAVQAKPQPSGIAHT